MEGHGHDTRGDSLSEADIAAWRCQVAKDGSFPEVAREGRGLDAAGEVVRPEGVVVDCGFVGAGVPGLQVGAVGGQVVRV